MQNFDLLVLSTAHREVIELDWEKLLTLCRSKIIFDGRRKLNSEEMINLGWDYSGIGFPR